MGKQGKRRAQATHLSANAARRRKQKNKKGTSIRPTRLVKPFWDNSKTQRENFAQLGLTLNVNEDHRPAAQKPIVKQTNLLMPTIEKILNTPAKQKKLIQSMDLDEQKRLRKLMKKHGEDYASMSRDVKINVYQKTGGQLKKRMAILKRLQEEGKDFWGKPEENPVPDHYDSRIQKFGMQKQEYKDAIRRRRRRKKLKEKKQKEREEFFAHQELMRNMPREYKEMSDYSDDEEMVAKIMEQEAKEDVVQEINDADELYNEKNKNENNNPTESKIIKPTDAEKKENENKSSDLIEAKKEEKNEQQNLEKEEENFLVESEDEAESV